MLTRIRPPKCTICDKQEARFQSSRWAGVRICGTCSALFTDWFIRFNLARDNPLFYELCAPNPEGSNWYYIHSPISGERAHYIPPPGFESEEYFPTGLDILGDLWDGQSSGLSNITGNDDAGSDISANRTGRDGHESVAGDDSTEFQGWESQSLFPD